MKAWLKSSRKSRLGNYHNFLPLCFCFCWFELGLKLALILFWFVLKFSFDEDQKLCKERCRYFKGNAFQISLKPVFFCWSYHGLQTSHLDDFSWKGNLRNRSKNF